MVSIKLEHLMLLLPQIYLLASNKNYTDHILAGINPHVIEMEYPNQKGIYLTTLYWILLSIWCQ